MKLFLYKLKGGLKNSMYDNCVEDIISAKSGNEEAMTKIINNNTGLIWSIVRRFKDRGYEIEDLYQIGCMGFIKSIKRFDESFDVKLSTYAVPYIMGEIKKFIRDDGPIKVSRSIKELGVKIKELQKEHLQKNGTDIKIEQIVIELNVSREDIVMALDCFNSVDSIYEVSGNSDDDGISILDRLSNNIDEAKNIADRLSLQKVIEELNERERQIIMLRYYKGSTQMQVAKILGITQVQVSRIEKKILEGMKQKLAV